MENNIKVIYEVGEEKAAKYNDIKQKMLSDKEFLAAFDKAEAKEEVYDLLKEKNYIDFSYEEFLSRIEKFEGMTKEAFNNQELSLDQLEHVVGGSIFTDIGNFFEDHWKDVVKCVPFVGSGVVKIVEVAKGETTGGFLEVGGSTFVGGLVEIAGSVTGLPITGYVAGQIASRAYDAIR